MKIRSDLVITVRGPSQKTERPVNGIARKIPLGLNPNAGLVMTPQSAYIPPVRLNARRTVRESAFIIRGNVSGATIPVEMCCIMRIRNRAWPAEIGIGKADTVIGVGAR